MPMQPDAPGPGDPLQDVKMYMSPYENWNFGKGRRYAFPAMRRQMRYISALAEFRRDGTAKVLADLNDGDSPPTLPDPAPRTWRPTLWNTRGLSFTPFVVENSFGRAPSPEELRQLLEDGFRASQPMAEQIKEARFRVAFPVSVSAMNDTPQPPIWSADPDLIERIAPGRRISIIAVIDDGLPFAHRNFRDITGTRSRVEFCWLQSAVSGSQNGSVLFGKEYTRHDIEDLMRRFDDEDALYREAGAFADSEDFAPMLQRHASHGAHVMDIAAGCDADKGEPVTEEIRIIAVQLPSTIAWDTSGFGKDMYMLCAFHYIFERARRIAAGYGLPSLRPGDPPAIRLVVNFSYGFSGGRHDGETELEAAIDQLIKARRDREGPTALVLPAGNMFLDRLHAVIEEADFVDDKVQISWRVQPNDRTPNYLELWFGARFEATGYHVELYDPHGERVACVEVSPDTTRLGGDDRRIVGFRAGKSSDIGQISADKHRNTRWRVLVVLAPTEPDDDQLPGADAGTWAVVVVRTAQSKRLAEPIRCWIQRDADPELLRSGSRQSYFDDFRNLRFASDGSPSETDSPCSYVRRYGSLNGLASGATSLIVGGYSGLETAPEADRLAKPAAYSSAGTALAHPWPFRQVDCSSLSDRGALTAGNKAAGTRSGSVSFLRGTSAAAPSVARCLAEIFASKSDEEVAAAERLNYLPLLPGWEVDEPATIPRLGKKRVPRR